MQWFGLWAALLLPVLNSLQASDEAAFVQKAISIHNGTFPNWVASEPLLAPSTEGFDSVAVKDPSVVFHADSWHIFYTAKGKRDDYSLGYVHTSSLQSLGSARRTQLSNLRGYNKSYAAAPQVFYFEPHKLWYLVYQTMDVRGKFRFPFYPVFSTNPAIEDVEGWTAPQPLLEKDSLYKWIDFWVICDSTHAYLFYTRDQKDVIMRSTKLEDFPSGWVQGKRVLENIHEATHIYKARDLGEYHMIFEVRKGGMRSFGMARAPTLRGPWQKTHGSYAEASQLIFRGQRWTDVVSHGEALRTNSNQKMEYDSDNATWLIQGMTGQDDGQRLYDELPWSLGLINLTLGRGVEQTPGRQ